MLPVPRSRQFLSCPLHCTRTIGLHRHVDDGASRSHFAVGTFIYLFNRRRASYLGHLVGHVNITWYVRLETINKIVVFGPWEVKIFSIRLIRVSIVLLFGMCGYFSWRQRSSWHWRSCCWSVIDFTEDSLLFCSGTQHRWNVRKIRQQLVIAMLRMIYRHRAFPVHFLHPRLLKICQWKKTECSKRRNDLWKWIRSQRMEVRVQRTDYWCPVQRRRQVMRASKEDHFHFQRTVESHAMFCLMDEDSQRKVWVT